MCCVVVVVCYRCYGCRCSCCCCFFSQLQVVTNAFSSPSLSSPAGAEEDQATSGGGGRVTASASPGIQRVVIRQPQFEEPINHADCAAWPAPGLPVWVSRALAMGFAVEAPSSHIGWASLGDLDIGPHRLCDGDAGCMVPNKGQGGALALGEPNRSMRGRPPTPPGADERGWFPPGDR